MSAKRDILNGTLAAVSLASGVMTALITAGYVPAAGWLAASPGLATAGVLFAVSTCSLKARSADRRIRKVQQQCLTLTSSAVFSIAKNSSVDAATLGASVFVVRRTLLDSICGRKGSLRRVARLRFGDIPRKSRVKWTYGKGCIGRAWEKGGSDYQWWTTGDLREQSSGSGKGHKARENMSAEERAALAGKYCEVRARAIVSSEGKVIGVLSIDRPAKFKSGNSKVLNSELAEEVSNSTADLVAAALHEL